jgi:glycosyltransferase involved in cell wall biosynthesis
MLRGKDIVCISSLDWNAMWTSKQQIMHRLAQTNRVLYVEEPVTMLAPLKVPDRWRRWRAVAPQLERAEAGLWKLTPPPVLPFGNMKSLVNDANQTVLARYIRWAIRRLQFDENYILWTFLPTALALLNRPGAARSAVARHVLGERASGNTMGGGAAAGGAAGGSRRPLLPPPALVVYHCVDEHSAFPGFVDPRVVRGYDDKLTRRADLVITTSENLRSTRLPLNPRTYTVLNAADVEIFNRALEPGLPIPPDLASISQPRLGVVGLHDSRLDIEALEALAEADSSWQVVLIGPIKQGQVDEDRLRRHPNIHLLGEKPRPELPGYLKGLAVALIPYRANELTRNIFPLKLFEYLAAGLPVVAGGLPELSPFASVIGLPASPTEYPAEVRRALAEDDPERRADRVALAAQNTWDHRVEQISALVIEALRGDA